MIVHERVQVYKGGEGDKVRDIIITRQVVHVEIDKHKQNVTGS